MHPPAKTHRLYIETLIKTRSIPIAGAISRPTPHDLVRWFSSVQSGPSGTTIEREQYPHRYQRASQIVAASLISSQVIPELGKYRTHGCWTHAMVAVACFDF